MDTQPRPTSSAAVDSRFGRTTDELHKADGAELTAEIVIDLEGRIQRVGKDAEQLLGYTPDQIRGTRLYDRVYGDDLLELFRGIVRLAFDREPTVGLTLRMKTALGAWRPCAGRAVPLLDGKVIAGILLTLYPLTGVGLV